MISVITPSYGQLDWLRLCIASVADQEGVAIEHIIQDGGTEGISERQFRPEAERRDYRLRLCVEKDDGMYDAINRGLRRSSGEICAYLNCDEQYLPGALARVEGVFEAYPKTDVLFGDFILVDKKGNPLSYRRVIPPSANHIRFAHLNTASCAMFFRRRLVERGFLFNTQWRAIGDAVWVRSLLECKVRMQVLREPLAIFTITGQNLGASTLSEVEVAQLSANARFARVRRMAAILTHRSHKLLSGAYRRRHVDFDLYTMASPARREHRCADRVGFGWPSAQPSAH